VDTLRTMSRYLLFVLILFGAATAVVASSHSSPFRHKVVLPQDELTAEAVLTPRHEAVLSSQLNGRVEKILVKEGDSFKKGDILIALDCIVNKAQLRKTLSMLRARRSAHQSNQALSKLNAISDVDLSSSLAELEEAMADADIRGHSVRMCHIRAPFNGKVVKIDVHPHETVRQGEALLEVIDNDDLFVELIVPSSWLKWMHSGYRFKLNVSETGKSYKASVTQILPKVDAVSQSVRIIGKVQTKDAKLIVGVSFTFVKLTVIVAVSVNKPASLTSTVKLNTGLVSKSNTLESLTVI